MHEFGLGSYLSPLPEAPGKWQCERAGIHRHRCSTGALVDRQQGTASRKDKISKMRSRGLGSQFRSLDPIALTPARHALPSLQARFWIQIHADPNDQIVVT
jgi:hypothetical protein